MASGLVALKNRQDTADRMEFVNYICSQQPAISKFSHYLTLILISFEQELMEIAL